MHPLKKQLKNKLIVSCQADMHEPLGKAEHLAAMSKAAQLGGAAAIRAENPVNIRAIKQAVNLPVIGLFKVYYEDSPVYITPTFEEAKAVASTGCDIIAMDATLRKRPKNEKLKNIVEHLRNISPALLMADIATIDDAQQALELGFDFISTTLSGYTEETKEKTAIDLPDFDLLKQCVDELGDKISIVAEGRIWTPEQAGEAIKSGAFCVVVGSAITRPWLITERFVKALQKNN